MDEFSSKKANDYLMDTNQELKSLFAKVKHLEELNKRVSAFLDPTIAKYCQVANLSGKQLVFVVANGSIATQIRFQSLDLLRKFKQDPVLQKIQEISCKVRPPNTQTARLENRKGEKMRAISHETSALIRDMASSLEDPELRKIMEKIAGHTVDEKS